MRRGDYSINTWSRTANEDDDSTEAHPGTNAGQAAVGNAVFPNDVSPKYSSGSVGKARMETCLDQYRANKANNANGGLKWISEGRRLLQRMHQAPEGAGLTNVRLGDRDSIMQCARGVKRCQTSFPELALR